MQLEDQTSPLIEEPVADSPLIASEASPVDLKQSEKNYAFMYSLSKLSKTGQENWIQAIRESTLSAEDIISITGSKDALTDEVRSAIMQREAGIIANSNAAPDFVVPFLSDSFKELQNSPYVIEREAAETITIMADAMEEYGDFDGLKRQPSAVEYRMELLSRKMALYQEMMKQSEERGEKMISEREGLEHLETLGEFGAFFIPWESPPAQAGHLPSEFKKTFWDNLLPGELKRKEAQVLMDPELTDWTDFEKLAPEFVKSTFDATTHATEFVDGKTGEVRAGDPRVNKLLQEMLIYEAGDTPSPLEVNTFATLDWLGVGMPVITESARGAKGALSSIKLFKSMRLPNIAADLATEAVKKAETIGLPKAAEEIIAPVESVEAAVLPKILNPDGTLVSGVGSMGRVDENLESINSVMKELGVITIEDLNRLSPEELQTAILATLKKVEKRTGRKIRIADVEEFNSTPGTGLYTPALRIAIGKADGGGYGTLAAVNRFAESLGLTGYRIKYIDRKIEGAAQPKMPRVPPELDESFSDLTERLKNLDPETQKGIFWVSAKGQTNEEILQDINQYTQQTGRPVEVVVTKDGNLIATQRPPLSSRSLRNQLGFGDEEVGVVVLSERNAPKTLEEFYDKAITIQGKPFKLKDAGAERVVTDNGAAASVVRDEKSGEYFLLFETGVDEKTFFTPIKMKANRGIDGLAQWIAGGRLVEDPELFGKASLAEGRRNAVAQSLKKMFEPKFQVLKKEERDFLNTIARTEDEQERWMDDIELADLYSAEFGFGSDPTKFIEAHRAFKRINDVDFFLRNHLVYSQLSTAGWRTVGISKESAVGSVAHRNGRVIADLKNANPNGLIFDVSEGKLVNWADLDKAQLEKDKYVLVKYLESVEIGNEKHIVNNVLVRKEHLEDSPLAFNQLGYRPGGHRIYSDEVRWWVKGVVTKTQPSTGQKIFVNPITMIGGVTKEELIKFTNDLNDYVIAAELAIKNNTKVTKGSNLYQIRSRNPILPTTEEILEMVRDGRASSSHPFEIVGDRELPSAYRKSPEAMLYVEESHSPVYDHMRDLGRLYYSTRGKGLKIDYRGEDLPVLNVFETVNQALNNITKNVAMTPYKISKMEKWVAQYKDLLDLKPGMSLDEMFNANFIKGLPKEADPRIQAANAQRSVTRRLLNWQNPNTRTIQRARDWLLRTVEGAHNVERDAKGVYSVKNAGDIEKKRKAVRTWKGITDWANPNQLSGFASGITFDGFLGLANFFQIPLQLGTAMSMFSIDASSSLRGMEGALLLRGYKPLKDAPMLRKVLSTPFGRAILSGMDEDEFIHMADSMKAFSGFNLVTKNTALLDDVTEGKAFRLGASIPDKIERVREMGRVFFYESEKFNKMTAYQVAWRMVRKEQPKLDFRSQRFKELVNGKASTLALGMDNASSAAWQKAPVVRNMAQFWSYPVRVLEMAFGEQLTYQQKLRFFLGQAFLYGPTAGLPAVGFITDRIDEVTGPTSFESDPIWNSLKRGAIDTAMYYGTGADTLYGERWGSGRFVEDLVREWFGMSRFGPTSPVDFAGGASWSFLFDTTNGLGKIGYYGLLRMNNADKLDPDQGWELVTQQIDNFAKLSGTWNNASKALVAWETGNLYSRRKAGKDMTLLVEDIKKQEAIYLAFGFQPAEMKEISILLQMNRNRKATVTDFVGSFKQIDFQFVEAFRAGDEKRMTELENEIKAFWLMIPDDYHEDVKDQLDRYDYNDSLAKSLVEGWQEGKTSKQIREEFSRKINE